MSSTGTARWQRPDFKRLRQGQRLCPICGRPQHVPGYPAEVLLMVALNEFGIDRIDLLSKRRHADLVQARAFVAWAMRELGKPRSYPVIARALRRDDHTTIYNLHQKAFWLRRHYAEFDAVCARLAENFHALMEHTHALH